LPGSKFPDAPSFAGAGRAVQKPFPASHAGGGMFSFFTELNRKAPPEGVLDYVTHTTSPIVHAADDVSVMETLEGPSLSDQDHAELPGQDPLSPRPQHHSGAQQSLRGQLGRLTRTTSGSVSRRSIPGSAGSSARPGASAMSAPGPRAASGGDPRRHHGPAGMVYAKTAHAQPYFDDVKARRSIRSIT
jgi:hypothetical protein